MHYLQISLDDHHHTICGNCAICKSEDKLPEEVAHENGVKAAFFLQHSEFEIRLKLRIQSDALSKYGFKGILPQNLRGEVGKSLSRWGDAGWGKIVAEDKHRKHFRDELVDAFAEMVNDRWDMDPRPRWVTCIPSNRHPELVPSFAKRVAERLDLPFVSAIKKVSEAAPQKEQENAYFQCKNLDGIFEVSKDVIVDDPVLLIDDAIDSAWTLTIASALLRQAGSGVVYPATLTSTSVN